jgi:hypothetical protein
MSVDEAKPFTLKEMEKQYMQGEVNKMSSIRNMQTIDK